MTTLRDRDAGLTFRATVRLRDGILAHRETTDRRELLAWLDAHPDGIIIELDMEARDQALPHMLAALRFGAKCP